MIRPETIEQVKQDVLNTLRHLKPIEQEKWDDSWSIFSEKYNPLEISQPIGQLVLASLLRPIEPGPHNKVLHIFYSELVQAVMDDDIEVCFLFKWI